MANPSAYTKSAKVAFIVTLTSFFDFVTFFNSNVNRLLCRLINNDNCHISREKSAGCSSRLVIAWLPASAKERACSICAIGHRLTCLWVRTGWCPVAQLRLYWGGGLREVVRNYCLHLSSTDRSKSENGLTKKKNTRVIYQSRQIGTFFTRQWLRRGA